MIDISKYARWRLLFYLTVLVTLSVIPLGSVSEELIDVTVIRIRGDYLLHMLVYLPIISLMLISFPKKKLLMVVLALVLGVGLEYFQMLLPYRAFNINDLVANVGGVVLGGVIFRLMAQRRGDGVF